MATTNVVSALINVDQDVTEDWPLEMKDLGGKVHPLDLQPGEVRPFTPLTACLAMDRSMITND